jgi:hypothetical protein
MKFNFVTKLLELTQVVESPTSYLEWAAYATIAAVLRHNVYYDFPARRTRLPPNMYILLVGDSGSTRKSTPLKISNFLLKQIGNTKLIEGRASIQGVLKELAEVKTVTKPERRMIKFASAIMYSEELAAFFVKDPSVGPILTDIYDYKETHSITLRTQETVQLEKVCINLFSATNSAFLADMFTKTDLYGGMVGRTIFIMENRARHKDLGLRDSNQEQDWDVLVHHLRYLSRLEGPVKLAEDALTFMEEWYNTTDFTLCESKTGFEPRAHTHALKLALVYAACEENFKLEIQKRHCVKAVDTVTALRKNYHKLVATVGFSNNDVRQAIKDITVILFNKSGKPVSREEIFRDLFGRIDADAFDRAIATLDQTGYITLSGTNKPLYSLSTKGKEAILGELKITGEPQ